MGEGLWSKGKFPVPITRIRSHITQGLWGPSGGRPGGSWPSLSPAQAPPAQGLPVSPGRALPRPRAAAQGSVATPRLSAVSYSAESEHVD